MKEQIKLKRPQFIVFSDMDGTINLKDKQLKNIILIIKKMGGMFIPITGRTIGDVREQFIKNNVQVPEILVGDDGGGIYYTPEEIFLSKKILDKEKNNLILQEAEKLGINPEFIRYTDGENIFASNDENVQQYYKENLKVNTCKDIPEKIREGNDITKITMAGSKEKMELINEYLTEIGFWGHIDKTKFPAINFNHYRIDITQNNISKGNAVKEIINGLKPTNGYACFGNGFNDISMFEQAIKDGMIAAIIKNPDTKEMIFEMKKYAKDYSGKVVSIPSETNLANRHLLKISKLYETRMKKENKEKIEKFKTVKDNGKER